ncbi:ras and EF-hand domain-containing protein-like isoform X3 [Leptotrombidium deliense]|uniref:Ras and EF-hand domain-containing protein-like isoform X3 n=1 Tax=Leptotrombidium deliense TaxID=299467 RepID=A0A443SEV8_9ACAR|nr:ras and EF-hand domain-containing protein-like isoform X3 [Leptotrombidium deliense]
MLTNDESEVSSVKSESEILDATGPPERAYNVIFVGDASVGKTSFISRVVKNSFVNNLSATLGIDFHVRTLNIRGKNITLQLWDTAGQERYRTCRFRSLTKSYFRKADGIILMYDVTSEPSFLNVREWMNAIEDTSGKILPVVIVGNKTDLRDMDNDNDKCVKTSSGHRIAEQYKVKFYEASVKDGSNVLLTVGELTK